MTDATNLLAALQGAFSKAVQDAAANMCEELAARVAVLEARAPSAVTDAQLLGDKARVIDALNSQEWFWAKLQNFVEETTERVADAATIAQNLTEGQLAVIAGKVDLSDLAEAIELSDLAEAIELSDLAEAIDLSSLAGELDFDDTLKTFFYENSFSIRPNT